jgi:LmbE family N-acetylglucosaminyl deacetylase
LSHTLSNDPGGDFSGRVIVVSPHLDDAVMSLGATIAKAVQSGAQVEVLTVFGYAPLSDAPAGPWDSKSGFRTEGEAARARRAEDDRACLTLGATPRWLSYGAEPYDRHGGEEEIWSALDGATRGADLVLLPGWPLAHPDHAELTQLALRRGLSCRKMALYAEQPYSYYQRNELPTPQLPPSLQPLIRNSPTWTRLESGRVHRRTKLQAVGAYRSQLRQLGLGYFGLRYMLWHEAARGGEAIAWLS